MGAKTINLSLVLQDYRAKESFRRKGYKLCVCLRAKRAAAASTEQQDYSKSTLTNKLGRLFAVKSRLGCEKFSRSFCQQQQQAAT